MKTIWKFTVPVKDEVVLMVPKGAEGLCVQAQRDQICAWAIVDPEAELEPCVLRVVGTNHPIDDYDQLEYMGTVQLHNGDLVFHVFEKDMTPRA